MAYARGVGGDLHRPDLLELDWSPDQRHASLSVVFDHAVGLACSAEAWYASKRPAKKLWGRVLRLGALVLGAVAVVLPTITEIFTAGGQSPIAPGWTAVVLAIAASLIALDHFYGFSKAWMRFMATEIRLTRLRHDFEYQWNARRSATADPPTEDDIEGLLALACALVIAVDDVVGEETTEWIGEFRGNLEQAEKSLAAPAQS